MVKSTISVPPLTKSVTLDKLLKYCVSNFYLQMGMIKRLLWCLAHSYCSKSVSNHYHDYLSIESQTWEPSAAERQKQP